MWLSKRSYQRLLDQIAELTTRALRLEESLELERHENRISERHWANSLLRAKNSFPQQQERAEPKPPPERTLEQLVDPGEREALRAEALRLGLDPIEADRVLAKERGLTLN